MHKNKALLHKSRLSIFALLEKILCEKDRGLARTWLEGRLSEAKAAR